MSLLHYYNSPSHANSSLIYTSSAFATWYGNIVSTIIIPPDKLYLEVSAVCVTYIYGLWHKTILSNLHSWAFNTQQNTLLKCLNLYKFISSGIWYSLNFIIRSLLLDKLVTSSGVWYSTTDIMKVFTNCYC